MIPLLVVVVYNRRAETAATLASIVESVPPGAAEVVVVDNGSTDGARDVVAACPRVDWAYLLDENIGCPRALNYVLERHRLPGQDVIKVDNDVRLQPGFIEGVPEMLVSLGYRVSMVGAYYPEVLTGRLRWSETVLGHSVHYVSPVIGHAVWHTGVFMDRVGHFDVLASDHVYGFEDLIMSHKADTLGWPSVVWEGWPIENLQRRNSLGAGRDEHVERMRPLYTMRMRALTAATLWTGADGQPVGVAGGEPCRIRATSA